MYQPLNIPNLRIRTKNKYNFGMFSKWRIKGCDNYVFGEDKKMYRLPYNIGNRYRLHDRKEWLSQNAILKRKLLYLDPNPIELIKKEHETPFD